MHRFQGSAGEGDQGDKEEREEEEEEDIRFKFLNKALCIRMLLLLHIDALCDDRGWEILLWNSMNQ
jgi:hypothetical protein